jgi:dTDP-4-dehydrorhamnose 3,5-epimerase
VTTSQLDFVQSTIPGVIVIRRTRVEDSRGFLSRLYAADAFHVIGVRKPIAQINHTLTRRTGAVRGLHFQLPPHAETKIVSCVRGEVFDVAVDLRKGSPTFLQWHAEVLSAENLRSLVIPEGFAHGFQALMENCELIYQHTAGHQPDAEAGVSATDPAIGIPWPLTISEMSDRDRSHQLLNADFEGVQL